MSFPRLLLLLALALSLRAGRVARAEPPTAGTPLPTPTTLPPRPAASFGPEVPRGAVARFLAACRKGHYARAAEYLNLRQIPQRKRAQRGPVLARELETVLDRALWVDVERLSDQPDGDPDDGLPALRDSLGTIETASSSVEVLIERVPQPGGTPEWKVAASTVAAIPALYDEFGWGPLGDVLPAPFFELRLLDVRLWQWLGLALLVAASWLVARLFRRLIVRVAHRVLSTRPGLDGSVAEHVAGPVRLTIALAVFASGLRFLALAVPPSRFLVDTVKALAIVALTWLLLRVLDVLAVRFERGLDQHGHPRAVATVPLGRRTLKVFVGVVALIAALQNFGFNVTGLIAGLGVGGLVVALAAQKTLENLFGSVSLVADQPVRVGDVCRFGDTVGTIEDIGLRSTRVRTIDRTLVTIPNAQFSTLALENLTRRDRMRLRATLTLPQGTGADRIREVLVALRAMLAAEPRVDGRSAQARFARMGPHALEIELIAYVHAAGWEEFVAIREDVFLRALDVLGVSGTALR